MVLAIAEEQSVSRAALRLHLSQSALSHHLKRLEENIGGLLFHRQSRRMLPTAIGEEFQRHARRICDAFENSETAIDALLQSKRRVIRIGTECYTSYHWLPQVMTHYQARVKDATLRIVVGATQRPIHALQHGEIDLAIVYSQDGSANLRYDPLFRDELLVVVPAGHPLASRRSVEPAEIANETFILYSTPDERNPTLDDFFYSAGVWPKEVWKVQLTEAIIELVKANLGISVMASWLIQPYLAMGGLRGLRLSRKGVHRQWKIASLKSITPSLQIKQFAASLASVVRARSNGSARYKS